jgi:hypothetical protein
MKVFMQLLLGMAKLRLWAARRCYRRMSRLYDEAWADGDSTTAWIRLEAFGRYDRWVARCKRRIADIECQLTLHP